MVFFPHYSFLQPALDRFSKWSVSLLLLLLSLLSTGTIVIVAAVANASFQEPI